MAEFTEVSSDAKAKMTVKFLPSALNDKSYYMQEQENLKILWERKKDLQHVPRVLEIQNDVPYPHLKLEFLSQSLMSYIE